CLQASVLPMFSNVWGLLECCGIQTRCLVAPPQALGTLFLDEAAKSVKISPYPQRDALTVFARIGLRKAVQCQKLAGLQLGPVLMLGWCAKRQGSFALQWHSSSAKTSPCMACRVGRFANACKPRCCQCLPTSGACWNAVESRPAAWLLRHKPWEPWFLDETAKNFKISPLPQRDTLTVFARVGLRKALQWQKLAGLQLGPVLMLGWCAKRQGSFALQWHSSSAKTSPCMACRVGRFANACKPRCCQCLPTSGACWNAVESRPAAWLLRHKPWEPWFLDETAK